MTVFTAGTVTDQKKCNNMNILVTIDIHSFRLSSSCTVLAFSALTLLVGWQEGHPAWLGAGMVPLTVSCFSKIQIGFRTGSGSSGAVMDKGPLNGGVGVCV